MFNRNQRVKQLTWKQADELCKKIAFESIGFANPKDPEVKDAMIVAERAAFTAFELAGCLDDDKRKDHRRNEVIASRARASEERFKLTGSL